MLEPAAMERALSAAFAGRLMVGLMMGATELADPDYARQPLTLSGAKGKLSNVAEVRFPPMSRHLASEVTGWIIVAEDGEIIDRSKLDRPRRFDAEEAPVFRPGSIVIQLVDAGG